MSVLPWLGRVVALERRLRFPGLGALAIALLLWVGWTPSGHAQTAPLVTSLTPTNGAVDVPTNSSIVFVFDQDMKTTVTPIASKPGFWVGNFEISPTNLSVSGKWSADKRTLTLKCTPGWPYLTNIIWTLNPPTNGAKIVYPQFSGTNKVLLATVSGGFTTAAPPPPPPTVVSISPSNNAVEVPLLSSLVLTFDEDMDTSVVVSATGTANCGFSPANAFSNGVWSADKRTLTFPSLGQLPVGRLVGWDLNPPATSAPLKNSDGEPLAFYSGSFTVLTNTGGSPNEICQGTTNQDLGLYTLMETLQPDLQVSANTVLPLSNSVASFIAFARSPNPPKRGFSTDDVTNGSLSLPDGTVLAFTNEAVVVDLKGITNFVGNLGLYDTNTTDTALMTDVPSGPYVMRLDQQDEAESTVTMNIPAFPPVPTIVNYDAAQAIDAGQDFILQWNQLPGSGPGPFIQLKIQDTFGKLIFAAPNPCVSRTLDPSATSVLIPANTFRPGVIYQGTLQFVYEFYYETNVVPQMVGLGTLSRTTSFPLLTSLNASTGGVTRPSIAQQTISSTGQPALSVHGAPGAVYTIQRAASLFTSVRGGIGGATWTTVGVVTADGSGNASYTDTSVTLPAFYRVLGN